MQTKPVVEVLRALCAEHASRSQTARLQDVFEDLEAALRAGVSRSAVLEALRSNGYSLSMRGFETALYRIRERRRAQVGFASNSPMQAARGALTKMPLLVVSAAVTDEAQVSGGSPPHDARQLRERLASQFITSQTSNPLLKRIQDHKAGKKNT